MKEGKSERTLVKFDWLLGLIGDAMGAQAISEIKPPQILAILRPIETDGKLETAQRLRATISEVFRYAVATGRAENDPTTALRGALASPKVQHRAAIIDPAEFGALLRAIDGYSGAPEIRIALNLLALTFVRPGELRLAQWIEFDIKASVWSIPAERMKMRRAHRVPLTRQALELLNELRELTGHRHLLLPGARGADRAISDNTLNATLRRLGYRKEEMTAHGFRAAASSMLNERGLWNPDAIEAQLAHVDANTVRRAYARAEYWDERVRMMKWWADKLDSLRAKPAL